MSQEERKIADTHGKFAQVARDGQPLDDANWIQGRILLSNKRLILAGEQGKRTIRLTEITDLGGRKDVNESIEAVPNYVTLLRDDDVILVTADDDDFEVTVHRALLNHRVVLAKHSSGTASEEANDWQKAKITLKTGEIHVAFQNREAVTVLPSTTGSLEQSQQSIGGETRTVLAVEHSPDEATVTTSFAASDRLCSILESVLSNSNAQSGSAADLDETEQEVLMALYSGVSPFDIPDFLDLEVDRTEAIYERLVEFNLVEEVRKRREVALNARGRNIASDAINES